MSITKKHQYVTREVLEEFALPDDDHQIVRVIASKGNNLHQVEDASGETFLASMPTKFRKLVWIKRGDFVMVVQIKEGVKVKGEISNILLKPHIDYIQQQGLWPTQFPSNQKSESNEMIPQDMLPPSDEEESGSSDAEEETEIDVVCNPNRRYVQYHEDNETDDSDEDVEN